MQKQSFSLFLFLFTNCSRKVVEKYDAVHSSFTLAYDADLRKAAEKTLMEASVTFYSGQIAYVYEMKKEPVVRRNSINGIVSRYIAHGEGFRESDFHPGILALVKSVREL